jgi:hypothetical protein
LLCLGSPAGDSRCQKKAILVKVLDRVTVAQGGYLLAACVAVVAVAMQGGCAAHVYADPGVASPEPEGDDAIVSVETVPPNIEVYPHYYYGDGYAYYVDGRWYHRGPHGWGYYRQEPVALQRQRGYVQRAPEAPRGGRIVQEAPEVHRERTYVQQAPEVQHARTGVVEAQPRRSAPPPRRPAPAEKREEHGH